jgi:hypothetical protein
MSKFRNKNKQKKDLQNKITKKIITTQIQYIDIHLKKKGEIIFI